MNTVSSLLDTAWYDRYRRISRLNIRSSIYDVTNRCNLRCKGCFFFSSNEHMVVDETDLEKWKTFVVKEKERGVNLAILIGGEPTLELDRVEAFYRTMPTYCATNGQIKVPRDRFPDMMVGISLWGDEEDEKKGTDIPFNENKKENKKDNKKEKKPSKGKQLPPANGTLQIDFDL